jgi:hypothetical protein
LKLFSATSRSTNVAAAAANPYQGCQMVYFQKNKNPYLGKFWRAFDWKTFAYFMTIWYILRPFGKIYGRLVPFVVIWYIFSILVCWDQAKSGNPAANGSTNKQQKTQSIFHTLG